MPESVLVLNETGAAILALCDGQRSLSAIAAELSVRYQRDVKSDVRTFLNRLAGKGLVDFDE
jgi:pyrroloquinoline quinone biosynthesis protein D